MEQLKVFKDTFGTVIEKGSKVVFVNNDILAYGTVTGYDNIGGVLRIEEAKEGSNRTFTHRWVSGNDPTILVRN